MGSVGNLGRSPRFSPLAEALKTFFALIALAFISSHCCLRYANVILFNYFIFFANVNKGKLKLCVYGQNLIKNMNWNLQNKNILGKHRMTCLHCF